MQQIRYISAEEAAAKWGMSQRSVIRLCTENRIPNAAMFDNKWIIPTEAEKPFDSQKENISKCENRRFIVTIEELVCEDFEMVADSIEDAFSKVKEQYENEDIVLSPGFLESKQMRIHDINNNYSTDWVKF